MAEFTIVLNDDSIAATVLEQFSDNGRIDSEAVKKSLLGYVLNAEIREILDEYYEVVKDAKFSDGLENVLDNFDLCMASAEGLYRDALKYIDDLSLQFSVLNEAELVPPIVITQLYDNFSKAGDCLSDVEDFLKVVEVVDGIRAWKLKTRFQKSAERYELLRNQFLSTFNIDLCNVDGDDDEDELDDW